MQVADQIIVLSGVNGTIKQGTYEELEKDGTIVSNEQLGDGVPLQDQTEPTNDEKSTTEVDVAKELEHELSEEAKDLSRQPGDVAVYKYYLKVIGSWKLLVFLFFVFLNVGSSSFSTIWLKWWADADGDHIWLYIGIYVLLGFTYSLGNGGYAW
jgi:ATP-binding cassette subfamily C (CFTR/MRP) protein 1